MSAEKTERQIMFNAISREREFQQQKWGADADKNELRHWVEYIKGWVYKADMALQNQEPQKCLHEILCIAALSVAALETQAVWDIDTQKLTCERENLSPAS